MQQDSWDARDYAKHSKAQEVWAKELIKKLNLKGDENILDLGCGDGKVTALLKQATSGCVVGVDKSQAMVEFATQSYSNINFLEMDAKTLKFESEFDIIFSNAVLHWINDQQSVLREIYKALKTNGKILLQFGGYGNAKVILKVMDDFIISSSYCKYFKEFNFPYCFPHDIEYNQLLKNVGFKKYNAQLIPKKMKHKSIEDFKGWIRTTWFPYIDMLPKELQNDFIDEFVKSYLKIVPVDDKNGIHVDMVRLEVEATK